VLNCRSQEGTANPPRRNPNAAAWFAWSISASTFCRLSQRPHVRSWNKHTEGAMARKECKVLNCSSQEATANLPSRNPNAPAWFVGYLDNLMAVCGISECFEDALLRQMQRPPQNLLANSSRSFGFQVGWLETGVFWPTHFVEYFNNLMSVHEVWKCPGKYAFRQMRLSP
jgi:hypothetical protein